MEIQKTIRKVRKPRVKKEKANETVKSLSDVKGNLLVVRDNGKRIIISLKLVGETRYRRIGIVNIKQRKLDIRRNRSEHLFRKNSSYGINYKLLVDSTRFDEVSITDEYDRWTVPKKFIIDNGKILNFSNTGSGYELQIFIELSKIEQYKKKLIL